jgi:hypothetical protein
VAAFAQWNNLDGSRVRWHLFAPPGRAPDLAFPRMPDSLQQIRGVPATPLQAAIYLIEAEHIDSYARFRAVGGQLLETTAPTIDVRVRISTAGTESSF